MKKTIYLLFGIAIMLLSCKKFVEKKQTDALIEAITKGAWVVEEFIDGSNDETDLYYNYEFLFDENGTVAANSPFGNTSGTWTGNIATFQITANFPSARPPVNKLSGTWTIKYSTTTYVEAEMGSGTTKMILHLRQKP